MTKCSTGSGRLIRAMRVFEPCSARLGKGVTKSKKFSLSLQQGSIFDEKVNRGC